MRARRVAWAGVATVALVLGCRSAGDRAELEDILTSGEKRYSQFREELVIRHFFQDRRNGFFLDVGCAWPTRDSTTYYLEKHLGWKGIGIDALPEYAPLYEKERPNTRFFNFLVTDHSAPAEKFYRATAVGLSSVEKDREWRGSRVRSEEIEVPAITLNELLDRNGVSRIDFLSMDIEGHEPQALAGFDIERFRPELVCVEKGPVVEKHQKLLDYFERHHYERIDEYLAHDRFNWYFRPRDRRPPS